MAATSTAKGTTYRLFKVAAELNIGKETIVEFLRAKGHDIPDKPTSTLSQEMYDLVMDKFEKEHRQIEKQRKKVDAYHEKRSRGKEDVVAPPEPQKKSKKSKSDESDEVTATEETSTADIEQPVEAEIPATTITTPVAEEASHPQEAEPIVAEAAEAPVTPGPIEAPEPVEAQAPVVEEAPPPVKVIEQEPELPTPPAVEEPQAIVEDTTAPPPPEPTPSPEERAAQLEAARRSRLEELRMIAQKGRKEQPPQSEEEAVVEEPTAVEEQSAPQAEAAASEAPATEEPREESSQEEGIKFVTAPPNLKGLTVLGKIDIASKSAEKDKKGKRKRKRIREAAKSIDISAEAKSRTGAARPATPAKPGETRPTDAKDKKGKKDRRRSGPGVEVNQEEVVKQIKQTFSRMEDSGGSARQKRSRMRRDQREERQQRRREEMEAEASVLSVTEFVTVAELANLMDVDVSQVIGKCIGLGLMVSINQRLDKDTIQLVADEFGYSIEFQQEYTEDLLADEEDATETLKPRAPIVTIMGHVDHGKTSLLDYVRNTNVVAGEAGGITQHIGAYAVRLPDGRRITFLDTPGHEAFTAMRARGAQVTDIVVLVVAADDSVMPQTVEAISHAQAAGVPIVVAINKVDKPEANPERIKQQLADRGVLVEEWGGKYQAVEISAKKGLGVDKLLDTILLEAELLDVKANPDRNARGVIIEAEIDKGKGVVTTVLVQKGTLKIGDNFIAGQYAGRVRALIDERGKRIQQAGPSEPAQVLGLSGTPTAGDTLIVLDSEQDTREIALRRQQLRREQEFKQVRHITLDDISDQIARGGQQHLPLIIKGDVDGSVEALADSLLRLSTPEVQISVIMKSVGEISESDVLLAAASSAIIIGFHVRPNLKARKLAEREGVDIRTYQIIYDTVNEVRAALEGMLKPEQKEVITGTVEIRETFKISKLGMIAGCYVQDGRITRNDRIRLLRDGLEIFTGSISSLRRLKDDVREVEQGFECGISLENMNDIKPGDIIEAFKMVEVKRKLEPAGNY